VEQRRRRELPRPRAQERHVGVAVDERQVRHPADERRLLGQRAGLDQRPPQREAGLAN
jgi:hypothetical protein